MERNTRYRVALLAGAMCLLAAAIGFRLYELQINRSDSFLAKARSQYERTERVWGRRGAIVDRRGRELAVSIDSSSLYAHPRRVEDPETTATLLSSVLAFPRNKILGRLRSDEPFVWLERRLETRNANAVRALGLPVGPAEALNFKTEGRRYYPRGSLGVHVIGCTNIDQKGIEGAEMIYDDILRGDPATYLGVRDGLGGAVLQLVNPPIRKPQDVVLTIDLVLQHIVERELARAVRETGAKTGSAIFLDPATGEVLALANYPTADPNDFGKARMEARRNRTVTDTYEPGSTFKVVTAAAVLEAGTVHPEQRFDCGRGGINVGARRIRDSSPHGVMSFREIVEQSSNAGMVHIVRTLSRERLHESIMNFGFTEPTGIELPGEQKGWITPLSRWSGLTRDSLAFGHEIAVTPIQMTAAIATVANGGVWVSPRILLGTRDEGGELDRIPAPASRRAISERTAQTLVGMLEGVVIRGTGKKAGVYGYRIAGKTGTAQKIVDRTYSDTDYVASFGGFGPVSSPRLAGLVILDEPRGDVHSGGGVAAPVFGRVMTEALTYMRVPPDNAPVLAVRMPGPENYEQAGAENPRRRVTPDAGDGRSTARVAAATAGTATRIGR